MKKLLGTLALCLFSTVVSAQVFQYYGPAAGVQKNTGSTYQNTSAASTDIAALWTGTNCGTTTNAPLLNGNCASVVSSTANPSATIGLTAVNGTATTAMTSDSAPALSQAISPTWTGTHLFNGLITSSTGTSGVTEGRNGTQVGVFWINSTGAGNSKVWDFSATATDLQARTIDDAFSSAHQWLDITRSGVTQTSIVLGNSTDKAPITLNGATTIPAPTSGTALSVTGLTGTAGLSLASSAGATNPLDFGWNFGLGSNAWALFTQSTDPLIVGSTGAASVTVATNSSARIAVNSSGDVTVNAPSSGVALGVTGVANSVTEDVTAPNTTGQSLGIRATAGTNSSDYVLNLRNAAASATLGLIRGDGSFTLGFNGTSSTVTGSAAGAVSIAVPSSGTSLAISATGGASTAGVSVSSTTSNFAISEFAGNANTVGTNSVYVGQLGDNRGALVNRANADFVIGTNNTTRVTIGSTGGLEAGSPTGADEGAGTINAATNYFLNGVNTRILMIQGACSTGTCTSSNADGFSTTISRASTGVYNLTYTPTFASGRSNCVVSLAPGSGSILVPIVSGASGTGAQVQMFTTGNVAADGNFSLMCKGAP